MNRLTELTAKLSNYEKDLASNNRTLKALIKDNMLNPEEIAEFMEFNLGIVEVINDLKDEIDDIENTPISDLIEEEKPIAQLIREAKEKKAEKKAEKPVVAPPAETPVAKIYAHKARAFVEKPSTHPCEAGIRNGKIYIPLCRMGATGKNGILAIPMDKGVHYHKIPRRMGMKWLAFIATTLKKFSCFDYDAQSFQRNIIQPNLDKICEDCGVSSLIIRERIKDSMYMGLQYWFSNWDLNAETFFTDEDLDF